MREDISEMITLDKKIFIEILQELSYEQLTSLKYSHLRRFNNTLHEIIDRVINDKEDIGRVLSVRVSNLLYNEGLKTVEQLKAYIKENGIESLEKIKNFGPKGTEMVVYVLKDRPGIM